MFRPIPLHVTRRRGFSLVLSLTVMAMLLLLCISIAALMSVEMRVARAAVSQSRARLNAMVGARIALGELQRLAGPDQRVTATADILCDPFETDPAKSSYYRSPTKADVVHPRWVGVWNSGMSAGANVPNAASGEANKVIVRTTDGVLRDSRFVDDAPGAVVDAWRKKRADASPQNVTTRFAGWLVSGNEAIPSNHPDALTPFSAIRTDNRVDSLGRAADTVLLGGGTLSTLPGPHTDNRLDYLGVRVAKVDIADSGNYAYWVSDEGVKARINLADNFEGMVADASRPQSGGMLRLLTPQRNDFSAVQTAKGEAVLTNYASLAVSQKNLGGWTRVSSFEEIPLIDSTVNAAEVAKIKAQLFHDVTFASAGLFTNVVGGGLQKDLTAFVQIGDLADDGKSPGSGLKGEDPFIDAPALKNISPKFSIVSDWIKNSSATAAGVNLRAADGVEKAYSVRSGLLAPGVPAASFSLKMPTWTNRAGVAAVNPVLAGFDLHFAAHLPLRGSSADRDIKYLLYPKITLWNPYAVPLIIPNDLRVQYMTHGQIRCNFGLTLPSIRSVRNYRISMPSGKLAPGQSVVFVPSPGQDFSTDVTSPVHGDVVMVPGLPSRDAYYIDRGTTLTGSRPSYFPIPGGANLNFYEGFIVESGLPYDFFVSGYPYDEGTGSGPFNQVFLTQGNRVFQQVNMDPWANLLGNDQWGYGTKRIAELPNASTIRVSDTETPGGAAGKLDETYHLGFRLTRLDEGKDSGENVGNFKRNINFNPMVNYNLRAARVVRHPLDGGIGTRVNNVASFSFITSERTYRFNDAEAWPADANKATPLLNAGLGESAGRLALYDMPRAGVPTLSLGRLQHAPILTFPWAPGFAVGNSFLPLMEKDASEQATDSTGMAFKDESSLWSKVNGSVQFNNYVRGLSGGTMPWGASSTDAQLTFVDWSFELNHALWDTYLFSGISAENEGWNTSLWSFSDKANPVPDSRLTQVASIPTSGYYREKNYALYRAASSMMQKGRFNVNSTSVIAWQSLLFAFRGMEVPTSAGLKGDATKTPFSRFISPIASAVTTSDSAYSAATWGGFRSLSDEEVRTLAQKIVTEVKLRGPFLGLSDFVNRRLKLANFGSDWTTRENEYLGALQAAINAANINESLSNQNGNLLLDRDNDDAYSAKNASAGISTAAIQPKTKVKDKLAGAPGYLMQSDLLEKLGPVLSARSDTFVIRSRGESADGVVAYVEFTVQRLPEPLVPGNAGAIGLPVNPKAISSDNDGFAGNQFFGRRMKIVSMRYIDATSI